MEEIKNIGELEQMRAEFRGFKSELKQQKIINEKIMRRAMQKDYAKERREQWSVVALSAVATPIVLAILYFSKVFPLWFLLMTGALLLSCVGMMIYRAVRFVSDNILDGDILTVAGNMAACRRFDNRSLLFFSIPVIVVWVTAFFCLVYVNGSEAARAMTIGGVIGGVVGAILGTAYLIDSAKRINRILAQIDEFKKL